MISMIKISLVFLGVFLIALNFYITSLYRDLYMRGNINTDKRVSLKILNQALLKTSNDYDKNLAAKCRKYYILFLTLFYTELFFVFFLILKS